MACRFAPLVMILHRVDFLFNHRKMQKVSMTNLTVAGYVGCIVLCDVAVLITWALLQPPAAIDRMTDYPAVYYPVSNRMCNTGLNSPFELAMLVEKCALLLFAIYKVSVFVPSVSPFLRTILSLIPPPPLHRQLHRLDAG